MLTFITGRASSGKTYETINRAINSAKSGEKVIILVPEQFSFECEKKVLSALGDTMAQNISVLSFSRICDEVDRVTGGVCSRPLKNSDIQILMKKAIGDCADNLTSFKRFKNSDGFAKKMAETVYELKINCISPTDLTDAAGRSKDPVLAVKLKDTAVIFETFCSLITEKYIDPSDKLNILYDKLEGYRFFEGKTVYIDSFDGFTGQQYKIIDRILSQSKDVFITLNYDEKHNGKFDVFAGISKLKTTLLNSAEKLSVSVGNDIVLGSPRYENESLAAVEEFMVSGKKTTEDLHDVTVCSALTIYDEAEFVARKIRKTVREEGARYRDMVIVARDTSKYLIPLKSAMEKNNIPLFLDERTPLSQTACAAMFCAAAELLCGITTERLFKFYKSGIEYFTTDELGTLENYAFIWDIDGGLWLKEWDMSPKGLTDEKIKQEDLENLNALRLKAVSPIIKQIKESNTDAKSIIASMLEILEKTGAVKSLINLYNERKKAGDTAAADVIRGSYDAVISVLDSIAGAYKNETITPRNFLAVLQSALSLETVGNIPASLDEVTFGAADRIRPARPKYVFILGANQGVFPSEVTASGVFSNTDRDKMKKLDLKIPDKTIDEAINEDYLVYTNVCSAKNSLTITYALNLSEEATGEPSPFLQSLCKAFDINAQNEPRTLDISSAPETPKSALSEFCRLYNYDKSAAMMYYKTLEKTDLKAKADRLISCAEKPNLDIKASTAQNLFGHNLKMSPSVYEKLSGCRFYYFCNYALRIKPIQKSNFSPAQRGTIIHYVLERIVKEHGTKLGSLSHKELDNLAKDYIEDYLKSVPGFESVRNFKTNYLLGTIYRSVKAVLYILSDEFKNTDFVPVACELKISDSEDGDIPAVKIPISEDNTLILSGEVDRLDKYKDYVRVVDYKTGQEYFKLSNVLVGQSMQMLLYLYAVCKDEKYGGKPAGVLYNAARRDTSEDKSKTCMNGIITDETDVANAMDKSFSGRFVPVLNGKNKESFVHTEDFDTIFKFLEKQIAASAVELYKGKVSPNPVNGNKKDACKYCGFTAVCRIRPSEIVSAENHKNRETLEIMERWENNEK